MMKPSYIFESPDGGDTIYRREHGKPERELWYQSQKITNMRDQFKEDQLWQQIRQAALTDEGLARLLEQVKMYYFLRQ